MVCAAQMVARQENHSANSPCQTVQCREKIQICRAGWSSQTRRCRAPWPSWPSPSAPFWLCHPWTWWEAWWVSLTWWPGDKTNTHFSCVCGVLQNKGLTFSVRMAVRDIPLPIQTLTSSKWSIGLIYIAGRVFFPPLESLGSWVKQRGRWWVMSFYLQLQPGGRLRSRPVEEGASEPLFAVRCVSLWPAADEVPQVLRTNQTTVILKQRRSRNQNWVGVRLWSDAGILPVVLGLTLTNLSDGAKQPTQRERRIHPRA